MEPAVDITELYAAHRLSLVRMAVLLVDDLIAKTSDPDTKSALEEVRASVEQVASGEITAENELEWLGEHMNKVEKVSDACLEEQ